MSPERSNHSKKRQFSFSVSAQVYLRGYALYDLSLSSPWACWSLDKSAGFIFEMNPAVETIYGCATLATGHYARIAESDDARGPLLRAAIDEAKDQTYMLAALKPESLARMRFPAGRAAQAGGSRDRIARRSAGGRQGRLPGPLFPGRDQPRPVHGAPRRHRWPPRGIVDSRGAVLGRHDGQHRFTVGQRRGIGIHAAEPLFVIRKDAPSGRVTVGTREELRTDRVAIRAARLHRDGTRVDGGRLRYRQRPLTASVAGDPGEGRHRSLSLELAEPFDGAAPGQLACLMDGDLVVGWGTIDGRAGVIPKLVGPMTSDEIRRAFLEYFESQDRRSWTRWWPG